MVSMTPCIADLKATKQACRKTTRIQHCFHNAACLYFTWREAAAVRTQHQSA